MFLLGAALMKFDFFSRRRRAWHWWMCGLGLSVGLAGEALAAWLLSHAGTTITWGVAMADPIHQASSLALCLGYVGAFTLLADVGALRWLMAMFAAVGRMALTNYLMQTFICTTIFYGHGFGYFGEVSRGGQILIVFAVWAALIAFSLFWMRRFRFGPFEWLWRTLSYMKIQPMRV
jgi:uncharacterized protein